MHLCKSTHMNDICGSREYDESTDRLPREHPNRISILARVSQTNDVSFHSMLDLLLPTCYKCNSVYFYVDEQMDFYFKLGNNNTYEGDQSLQCDDNSILISFF